MYPRPLAALALLASSILVAGCSAALRAEPLAFFTAYNDGCMTGYSMLVPDFAGSARKDESRYESDINYRRGFDFGYDECYFEAERGASSGSGG